MKPAVTSVVGVKLRRMLWNRTTVPLMLLKRIGLFLKRVAPVLLLLLVRVLLKRVALLHEGLWEGASQRLQRVSLLREERSFLWEHGIGCRLLEVV